MSGKLTKADYPPQWRALRATVLHRAKHACECRGECGSPHAVRGIPGHRCAIPNHARIVRDSGDPAQWWHEADAPKQQLGEAYKVVACVLTIAHLCQDSTCDDLEHLRAMCQRCHLRLDGKHHAKNATQTRWHARIAAGQLALLPEARHGDALSCCAHCH